MDFSLVNFLLIIFINAIGVWLIFLVYYADKQSKVNQLAVLWIISTIAYVILGYLPQNITFSNFSTLLTRLRFGAVTCFFISGYFFYIYFPRKEDPPRILTSIHTAVWTIAAFLSIFTPFIIKNTTLSNNVIDVSFGKLAIPYYVWTILSILVIFFTLFKKYSSLSKEEQLKTQYFLIGAVAFAILNLSFNIIFPIFRKSMQYFQLGDYSAILLIGLTTLAIVRKNLFGIKVFLTQSLVFLIAILLFVNFFTSTSTFEYFWKGAVLVAFCLLGWLLIKSVVKEIKQREQIDKYAKDLSVANANLEAAYSKLQTLDKAKSEFISIASHQLRTPLTAIKSYISMMIEGDYGKISKNALRSMKNVYLANERLIKMVNSLLDMSRIEAGRITLDFKPVKIDEMIADILREVRNEAENKNLKLRMAKDRTALPKIEADGTKLRNAIINLVDNAIKYTDQGEIIVKIKYNSFEGKMEIVVQDTGEGMSQEEIAKLFQSFSRADSGRKNWSEGSGLGLYIAKKFVEMHHGQITAQSAGKGHGSRFIIELPISQPQG